MVEVNVNTFVFNILDTVTDNKLVIISGEPGSGKSTKVPQILGDFTEGNVCCVQPRKIAAIRLAEYVGKYAECKVGYTVHAHSYVDDIAKIRYVTDSILIEQYQQDKLLSKYRYIIMDEAHERSVSTDIILSFIKEILHKRDDLHLIIMSATMNSSIFIQYFGYNGTNSVPALILPGTRNIEIQYSPNNLTKDIDYVKKAVETVISIHNAFPDETEEGNGDILIFLTSPAEISEACDLLYKSIGNTKIKILEYHGKCQLTNSEEIFNILPGIRKAIFTILPGIRKAIFTTNAAETSLTIPGITHVVDCGKGKYLSYKDKNIPTLSIQWATKSSIIHRMGRCARIEGKGIYHPLYSEEDYDNMADDPLPEIMRLDLSEIILKMISMGVENIYEFDFIQPPRAENIKEAMELLEEIGACIDHKLTDTGRNLLRLNTTPLVGKLMLNGLERGLAYDSTTVAAIIVVNQDVMLDRNILPEMMDIFNPIWGSIVTTWNVYSAWEKIPCNKRVAWCKENNFNNRVLQRIDKMKHSLKNDLLKIHSFRRENIEDVEDINEELAKLIYDTFKSKLCLYLNHPRAGYVLINATNINILIGRSSSVYMTEEPPTFIICIGTLNGYATHTSVVLREWITRRIPNFKFVLSLRITHSTRFNIGNTGLHLLLANHGELIKSINNTVQTKNPNAKVAVDIDAPNWYTKRGGTMTVHYNSNAEELVSKKQQQQQPSISASPTKSLSATSGHKFETTPLPVILSSAASGKTYETTPSRHKYETTPIKVVYGNDGRENRYTPRKPRRKLPGQIGEMRGLEIEKGGAGFMTLSTTDFSDFGDVSFTKTDATVPMLHKTEILTNAITALSDYMMKNQGIPVPATSDAGRIIDESREFAFPIFVCIRVKTPKEVLEEANKGETNTLPESDYTLLVIGKILMETKLEAELCKDAYFNKVLDKDVEIYKGTYTPMHQSINTHIPDKCLCKCGNGCMESPYIKVGFVDKYLMDEIEIPSLDFDDLRAMLSVYIY